MNNRNKHNDKNQDQGKGKDSADEQQPPPSSGSNNLSRLEQDVLEKQAAKQSAGQIKPGAVSSQGVAGLSQLEQDIRAKSQGTSDTATKPGATSVSGVQGLNRLEQDVVAKSHPPGASASQSTAVSQLNEMEQDVVAKTQGRGPSPAVRPGATAVDGGSGDQLSQMERDVIAKTQGRGTTAVVGTTGVSGLNQMERDIVAKQEASASSPATTPGARPVSSLNQLEQDLVAKQQREGAVRVEDSSLNQMERDIIAKEQARADVSSSSTPGVAGVGSSSGSTLSQMEQDVLAKQQALAGAATGGAAADTSLSQLESDVILKQQARGPAAAASPGVATTGRGSLDQMEQDVMIKQQARGPPVSAAGEGSSLSRMEEELTAKNRVRGVAMAAGAAGAAGVGVAFAQTQQGGGVRGGTTSLSQMEADLSAKTMGVSMPPPQNAPIRSMNDLENDVLNKGPTVTQPNHLRTEPPEPPYYDPDDIAVGTSDGYDMEDEMDDEYDGAPARPESAPVDGGTSHDDTIDVPAIGEAQIQGFVADPEVVDATGVAVIMSEDEEQELERKSSRKLIIGGISAVVLIIIIIVVVVVLVGGGGDDSSPRETPLPTMPPTVSPTQSPTSGEVVQAVEALSATISDLASFNDMTSPQSQAVRWITDDPFIDSEGLEPTDEEYAERYIMAVLYFTVGGDSWRTCNRFDAACNQSNQGGWLSSDTACNWFGVTCDGGVLVGVDFDTAASIFDDESIAWTLPTEIRHLKDIKVWLMSARNIEGSVGDIFDGWSNLEQLNLAQNNIDGSLPSFSDVSHPNLREIVLSENRFSGQIPPGYGTLYNLELLQLAQNELSSTVPSTIFSLPRVKILDLSSNKGLTGSIPSFVNNLSSVEELLLDETSLSGPLPETIFELTTIERLYLGRALFEGPISSSIGNLTNAVIVDLSFNQFSGLIPSHDAWVKLEHLEQLLLVSNPNLSGEITAETCALRGTNPGTIQFLSADCQIICGCCNRPNPCP
mmetsp:Transcript_2117/g.5908  ORF Transcript_2117/g.5908 Transcript_2117/m.5908 type:complete len:999 (-) Transcript_2117:409-3405(-)